MFTSSLSESKLGRILGFTLIELLVVISIISLLSSVVLSSLNSARSDGNDAKRITDMRQIQNALEQYYLDNGRYPYSGTCYESNDPQFAKTSGAWGYKCNSVDTMVDGHWIHDRDESNNTIYGALSPYLSSDPVDPNQAATADYLIDNRLDDGGTYYYWGGYAYAGCGDFYVLSYGLAQEEHPLEGKSYTFCSGSTRNTGGSEVADIFNYVE